MAAILCETLFFGAAVFPSRSLMRRVTERKIPGVYSALFVFSTFFMV
jgi:hypothetical protein